MQHRVDQSALRVNQLSIVLLGLIGFVLGPSIGAWFVLFIGLVLAVGTIVPEAGLFKLFYKRVLRPLGVMRPNMIVDDPRSHRFAQGTSAVVLLAGSLLIFLGWTGVGWAFAWSVIVMAVVNLLFGFCAGCFLYYQLARVGVVGG